MTKAFASQGDLAEKEISFTEIGEGLYAFTAEGDPNSGVIIGCHTDIAPKKTIDKNIPNGTVVM